MIISKKIEDSQLYLYMNGKLIYKRWLDTGVSKVFDVMAYDKYTLASYKDLDYEKSDPLKIKAKIKIRSTEDGGRKTGVMSGYRQTMFLSIMIMGVCVNRTWEISFSMIS